MNDRAAQPNDRLASAEGQGTKNLNIQIDDRRFAVRPGQSIAAALMAAGLKTFRITDQGEPRGLYCGMGVCYECLVEVDGLPNQRACLVHVRDGMRIRTHGEAP